MRSRACCTARWEGQRAKIHVPAGASAWSRTHEPMVKAEEVKPRFTLDQLHDPRLRRLRLKTEAVEEGGQPGQGGLGLAPVSADHQQIIGVADQAPYAGRQARSNRLRYTLQSKGETTPPCGVPLTGLRTAPSPSPRHAGTRAAV